MAHAPVDTHYAAPANTPIIPMQYLVPRTFSIFSNTLLAHLSMLSTPSLVPPKCSILYIGETCRQLNARFGEHLRSVEEKKHLSPEYQDDDDMNVAIHFNLPNHSIDDMEISALLNAPTEKLPRKTLEKKIIFELGTITPSGLNKRFSFLF